MDFGQLRLYSKKMQYNKKKITLLMVNAFYFQKFCDKFRYIIC